MRNCPKLKLPPFHAPFFVCFVSPGGGFARVRALIGDPANVLFLVCAHPFESANPFF